MADSGTGIQELMAAETRASQIVAEARIGEFNQEEDGVLVAIMKMEEALSEIIRLTHCGGFP
jgi:hypothetical protein